MKILLSTLGSLGDLHPYIAVGLGLKARGHSVILATSEIYRARVEGEGLNFHPVRPDLAGVIDNPQSIRKAFHARTGTEYVIRKMFLPYFEETFEDTLAAARDVDLMVGHPLAFSIPLVSDLTGLPWVSVALAPAALLSALDPPTIPGVPLADHLRGLGPRFWRPAWNLLRLVARRWGEPVNALRKKRGLPASLNPIVDASISPWGTHAWFSRVLAEPQADWPAPTVLTGFPFYDRLLPGDAVSAELRSFLDAGPPPVVFTLGSSAVLDAGDFYEQSAQAARLAGVRAVLLTGARGQNRIAVTGDSVFVAGYAPYSELLPHASATVHQGGVGTTAQALRAGKPMIVMPYAHDQPDNARRVAQRGVARVISRRRYRSERVAQELRLLLDGQYAGEARRAASAMESEDGVSTICDELEALAARAL